MVMGGSRKRTSRKRKDKDRGAGGGRKCWPVFHLSVRVVVSRAARAHVSQCKECIHLPTLSHHAPSIHSHSHRAEEQCQDSLFHGLTQSCLPACASPINININI